MHKGVLLLTQATDREDAIKRVERFMAPYNEEAPLPSRLSAIANTLSGWPYSLPLDRDRYKTWAEYPWWYKAAKEVGDCIYDFWQSLIGKWDGVWDWYVIGGRWSGALTEGLLDSEKMKAFWAEFEKQQLGWIGGPERKTEEQQRIAAGVLFLEFFPEFPETFPGVWMPVWRNQYQEGGEADDVMPLALCLPTVEKWWARFLEGIEEEVTYLKKYRAEHNRSQARYARRCLRAMRRRWFSFQASIYNISWRNMRIPKDPTSWWVVVLDMHS